MKTLQIEITKEDVDKSVQAVKAMRWNICKTCPTAQALSRYLNVDFLVHNEGAVNEYKDKELAKFPQELNDEIMTNGWADMCHDFTPGTYTIEVDEQYLKEEYK